LVKTMLGSKQNSTLCDDSNEFFYYGITNLIKLIFAAIIVSLLIINFVFESVSVDGNSMYPTLESNDRLIIEKVTYYFRKPKYNDIIVFKNPQNISERFIKRVIAVENQNIRIADNKLYINGILKEENLIFNKTIEDFNEIIVPENCVFVLGDNRNESIDSRIIGSINFKLISGKAAMRITPINRIGRIR